MIYDVSNWAIIIFITFVGLVLGLSFYFARKTKSADSYYAAGGKIHWGVNGIAFAGDYLSAASFLGICGMIAFSGYDGFIYSIGYLAGWVVALFIVAEPLKRMGKFTFTDALDSKFNSRAIKLTAAISTLVVSIFYLIPQMVGAGDLVVPLLGLPHWVGVLIVGAIVIFIVASAGMTSTTYVQFIKGALLIVFSTVLTIFILNNGIKLTPSDDYHKYLTVSASMNGDQLVSLDDRVEIISVHEVGDKTFAKTNFSSTERWFHVIKDEASNSFSMDEALSIAPGPDGTMYFNGAPRSERRFYQIGHMSKVVDSDGNEVEETGPLNAFSIFTRLEASEVVLYERSSFYVGEDRVHVYYPNITPGSEVIKPGLKLNLSGASLWEKINFISLMLALFLGTSALPHILIRYYTVPSQRDARKSTIVAIAAIGFFYILTMYMGLGAMINGVIDVESSNMAAPLLAKYFGVGIFSLISAIAFATVLGTVAGLIVASSGAIAHDFLDNYLNMKMDDKTKVRAGKMAAFAVGIVAILLGIVFKGMNVSFLVSLAFAVAASANLPAIIMILFWKKTTSQGIASSIVVGIASSVLLILLSPSMFDKYGLDPQTALMPIDNPGIFSIPLSFLTLVVVSLLTKKKNTSEIAV